MIQKKTSIKKIMVINLPRVNGYTVERDERFEHKDVGAVFAPLSHVYVAAIMEKLNYDVKFIDASGFNISGKDVKKGIDAFNPDIIFARISFDCQNEDLSILEYARGKGVITITRNRIISEVEDIKKDVLKKVDIFLEQDPDLIIEEVLNVLSASIANKEDDVFKNIPGISYLKDDSIITNSKAKEKDINSLPLPAYHLLDSIEPYGTQFLPKPFVSIYTTKGCPYGCKFCAYRKTRFLKRDIKSIIKELKYMKEKFHLRSFLIFDDTFTMDRNHVVAFCEGLMSENLTFLWSCCTRVDKIDLELLKIMKGAGCVEIAFGVESGAQKILDNCDKRIKTEQIIKAAEFCRKAGIKFYCMIVLGLPGENTKTIEETRALLKEIMPFYVQFCFVVPFPNTELYSYYDSRNFLRTKDWSEYCPLNSEPLCRTEELSYEELKVYRKNLYKSFLLDPKFIFQHIRPFDWKYNLKGLSIFMSKITSLIIGKIIR